MPRTGCRPHAAGRARAAAAAKPPRPRAAHGPLAPAPVLKLKELPS
jgi:hypothetical protein